MPVSLTERGKLRLGRGGACPRLLVSKRQGQVWSLHTPLSPPGSVCTGTLRGAFLGWGLRAGGPVWTACRSGPRASWVMVWVQAGGWAATVIMSEQKGLEV